MSLKKFLLIIAVGSFLIISTGGYFYYASLKYSFIESAQTQAKESLRKISLQISQKIDTYRKVVKFLALLPEIKEALSIPSPSNLENTNRLLNIFRNSMDIDVGYLLNSEGQTICSSNWEELDSFIGKNYSFRPYFIDAINGKPAV